MNPRSQNQIAKSKEALAAFDSKKAEIDAMLTWLHVLSDDHFNYSPDEIDWGHVGTLRGAAEAGHGLSFQGGRVRPVADPISRTRPARLWPPGLGVVGERWCSPTTEIIP
jgi:hypothetical protein